MDNSFLTLLQLARTQFTYVDRRRTARLKPRPIPYPIGIEKGYSREISRWTNEFVKFANEKLNPRLPGWIKEARGDSLRLDALEDEMEQFLRELDQELLTLYGTTYVSTGSLGRMLEEIMERTLKQFTSAFEKQVFVMAGTQIPLTQSWWPNAKKMWANENYRLIKSLSSEYITKLNTILVTGVQSGWTLEEMTEQIKTLSDRMTGYRARLIARDQIGKLNSAITREQSLDIGMDTYIWITARDERVRGDPKGKYPKAIPSHFVMDGIVGDWKNPNVYSDDVGKTWKQKTGNMESLHPGQAIMCRCVAAPVWATTLRDIDSKIERRAI